MNNNTKETDIEIIKKYTFHDTWYCTKINLLLASDSENLKNEAEYIKKLQNSIYKKAKEKPVVVKTCFRGMHQSEKEFNAYTLKDLLYIPSFLSTSKNQDKFYMASSHNSIIEIKLEFIPNNAIIIDENLSIYSDEEEEVLFGCYSKFRVVQKKKNYEFKGKNFEYYILLEHVNQSNYIMDKESVMMINFLGF